MHVMRLFGWAGILVLGGLALFTLTGAAPASAPASKPAFDPDNAFFAMTLEGFFPGQSRNVPKRMNVYMQRRNGQWMAALGTATYMGKAQWNTALMLVDPAALKVAKETVTGQIKVVLVADPWIPKDQIVRTAQVEIKGTLTPSADANAIMTMCGQWSATIPGEVAVLETVGLLPGKGEGRILGGTGVAGEPEVQDVSYNLAVYNLLPGKVKDNFQRRRAVSLGFKDGQAVSARLGMMDIRHNMYDYATLDKPTAGTIKPDTFSATLNFEINTLDGEPAKFALEFTGQRVAGWLVGSWKGSYTLADGKVNPIEGYFRGDAAKGAVLTEAPDPRPWSVAVKDFKPVVAGEHPRLFFRKGDLPELKRRAATPDGQAIIKRLREQLNGSDGESMPTQYNPATQAYAGGFKAGVGAYTFSHGAGFGFLYQLTGDKKYADLARECVEKAFAGQRSGDDRYAWVGPGGELRAGPTIGWTAVAYDLCYDGWEPEFRQKVALAIQNYSDVKGGERNKAEGITLRGMILTPVQGPGSNHYGAVVGGTGLAVLAIQGDPGTDDKLTTQYVTAVEKQIERHFLAGWGDGGYYKEGWGASRVGTQGAFLCLLQAMRVAHGLDFVNVERTNANYITMVPRVLLTVGNPASFPYRSNMGPTYGNPEIGSLEQHTGMSNGGYFSEGFGAISDRYKPALLWAYNHMYAPNNKYNFDTIGSYPHRAMLALVNWPTFTGGKEANPATVMPLATRDTMYEFFAFRNRFQDNDDVVTSLLINAPDGTKPREVLVWGMGLRLGYGEPQRGAKVTHYVTAPDGSGSLTAGNFALAVDHSRAAGVDVLVVTAGSKVPAADTFKGKARSTTVTLGAESLNVLTLSSTGEHPEPKVVGDKIVVGGQTLTYNSGKLVLGVFGAK
jgi:hypothetical protein